MVQQRASIDLACPKGKIDVEMLSGHNERGQGATFAARGCGKQAIYIRVDSTAVHLDSAVTQVPGG